MEDLSPLAPPDGTIAVMHSGQSNLAVNTNGDHEVCRAGKPTLNELMLSYAARRHDDPSTLLLINPRWFKTDLGGPGAPLATAGSPPGAFDVLRRHAGQPGLQLLDCRGQVIPW